MPPEQRGPWSQQTKDRWFLILLAGTALLILRLVLPYGPVLMFAAVVTIVTYPVYQRLLAATGRPTVAAILTTILFALVVVVPMSFMGAAFAQQAMELGQQGLDYIQGGGLERGLKNAQVWWEGFLPESLAASAPDGAEMVSSGLQNAATGGLSLLTTSIPKIVTTTMGFGIDTAVFVIAVATLYVQGPNLLHVIRDLAPLDEEYIDVLFATFKDLARRVVMGTFAVAISQGIIATIGYAIAGVHGLVFFGLLTSVFALIPIIGSASVYLPLVLMTFMNRGIGWAVFLLLWNFILTSQIDNFIRPFFLRGENNVHPLIIFVAVLGGLAWIGVPGALVGPTIVVVFAALMVIFRRDFLGRGARPQRG